MKTSTPGQVEWTRVDVDGWYTYGSMHSRGEVYLPLTRERFARFRRLLANTELGVDITCDLADTEGDRDTFTVSDHQRGLHATYVKPCLAPDAATQRVLECVDTVLFATDELYGFKCRLPPGE